MGWFTCAVTHPRIASGSLVCNFECELRGSGLDVVEAADSVAEVVDRALVEAALAIIVNPRVTVNMSLPVGFRLAAQM